FPSTHPPTVLETHQNLPRVLAPLACYRAHPLSFSPSAPTSRLREPQLSAPAARGSERDRKDRTRSVRHSGSRTMCADATSLPRLIHWAQAGRANAPSLLSLFRLAGRRT